MHDILAGHLSGNAWIIVDIVSAKVVTYIEERLSYK